MRLALALVLAALVLPSTAHADAPVAWQHKALALAQTVWHPTCGTLTLRFASPVPAFDSSTGVTVSEPAGWTAMGHCDLHLSDTQGWRSLGYPIFCTDTLHEAGHAANMPDNLGRGVMNNHAMPSHGVGVISGRRIAIWTDVDRRCIRPMDGTLQA